LIFLKEIYDKLRKLDKPEVKEEEKDPVLKVMSVRREKVVHNLTKFKTEADPVIAFIDTYGSKLKNLEKLDESIHKPSQEALDAYFKYTKYHFDCGNYSMAGDNLFYYRQLSSNPEKNFGALWGKLAAEILTQNWETALDDMNKLKDVIDSKTFASPLVQLQHRTWLIHWSLFIFFNHPNGRNLIIDMFLQEKYLNAIQMTSPHILRYLTTAVITNKKRRNVLKDLIKVIQQEAYTYRDPITEFLECLFGNFDFEGAQQKLRECEKVLLNDFFLVACRDEFIENARLFIFETYCRIHQSIDIGMLAEKLNMDQTQAERWIVNLIRNAKIDAKIDSANNRVIMGTQYPSIYQQVIEKTKTLAFRSYVLSNNLENIEARST